MDPKGEIRRISSIQMKIEKGLVNMVLFPSFKNLSIQKFVNLRRLLF